MFRYARRQLAASWGAVLSLAVVALVTALVLSAAPRAVAGMHGDHAAWTVGETTPLTRDLIAVTGQRTPEDWDAYLAGLTDLRDDQPEPLRGLLGAPDFQVSASDRESVTPLPDSDLFSIALILRATPHLDEHATLLEGRWPEATAGPADEFAGAAVRGEGRYPYEVAVSRQAAERFGWEAGHEYELRSTGSSMVPLSSRAGVGWGPLVVTGIYEQDGDPQGSWWRQNPVGGTPNVVQNPNTGLNAEAAAYVAPAMIPALSGDGAGTTTWIPVDGDGLRADQVPDLLAQLRGLDAQQTLVDDGGATAFTLDLDTRLTDVLATLLAQRAGVDAIVAVLATGPLGAALAVLALGARLVVDRRRPALTLLHARGASGTQLRALAGLEGATVGLAAAAVGFALGLWAVPGEVTAVQVALATAAGLGPGVALALAAGSRGLRGGRSDLSRARGRARWILEVLVLAGAVVSTALLLQRGVVAGSGAGADGDGRETVGALPAAGVDPLLAAAPLLLSLAVTLLAVRLFPLVTLAVERVLARRRDLVPFLGAARATRDPAGGVVPAIALVLCVSVAATAAVLYSTVTGGVAREAWHDVGADLRVSGPAVTPEVAEELRALDGVAAVAPVTDRDRIVVAGPEGNGVRATLFTTDAAALARAQEDVAGAPARTGVLGGPGEPASGPVPLIVTRTTGYDVGQEVELRLPDVVVPARVVEVADQVAGLPGGEVLVLADDARLVAAARQAQEADEAPSGEEPVLPAPPTRVALLALDDAGGQGIGERGAPATAVVNGVREVLPNAVVDDPAAQAREILRSPASTGLVTAFVVAVGLAGLLAGTVLVMTLMLAAPARARLLAVLRTLGLSPRQGRGLVGWEIGPWIAVAVAAGAALGGIVPVVLRAAVDLTALTGGTEPPAVRWDPALTAGLAAGLVVVAAAAVGLAAALGRRHGIAGQLRIGEER
ncbi:hypothetical protein [Myceligenerans salitolerans]|uniref:FtsX-like permease family protein n=1 Tax=Myceligenerans salitolerans TaxID=1230528 RepID=A0ABS3I602_9MICO|nr:hypothetical protein [Myceligenerans salitolerans]MBO0608430.1 hypothetical protein [Myceligenerans salitolerans]